MQKQSKTAGGLGIEWGATHRDGKGTLISRQASIEPPKLTCLRLSCLLKYLKAAIFYALLCKYHSRRVAYAEANRHKVIRDIYRTGEPSPEKMRQVIPAIIILLLGR